MACSRSCRERGRRDWVGGRERRFRPAVVADQYGQGRQADRLFAFARHSLQSASCSRASGCRLYRPRLVGNPDRQRPDGVITASAYRLAEQHRLFTLDELAGRDFRLLLPVAAGSRRSLAAAGKCDPRRADRMVAHGERRGVKRVRGRPGRV